MFDAIKRWAVNQLSIWQTRYTPADMGGDSGRQIRNSIYGENAVVLAVSTWITNALAASPLVVAPRGGDIADARSDHPALEWLTDGALTWPDQLSIIVAGLIMDGNAYLYLGGDMPMYSAPAETRINNGVYRMRLSPRGRYLAVPADMMSHFRWQVLPGGVVKGLSPLRGSLLHEIYADNVRAAKTSVGMARWSNPGLVFQPQAGGAIGPTKEEVAALQEAYWAAATDEFGKGLFLKTPWDIKDLPGVSSKLDFNTLAQIAAVRVCAALRVRPDVVALDMGVTASGWSSLTPAIAESWRGGVQPMQRRIAATLTHSLLPLYPNTQGLEFRFDNSKLRILMDDELEGKQAQANWVNSLGDLTRNERRALLGYEAIAGGDESGDGAGDE